jgi:hypothetical protein
MISPTPTTLPAIAPQTQTQEIPKEENQSTEPIQAAPVTVPPTHTAIPTPQITAGPTDPNRAFRDLVITKLDLMQDGKKAVLAAWDADDPTQAQSKIQELYHLIRNNNDASSFPKKMDYVRLNYYDYIDRMTQCAENFKQAAEMRERGENGSAQSYASAVSWQVIGQISLINESVPSSATTRPSFNRSLKPCRLPTHAHPFLKILISFHGQ